MQKKKTLKKVINQASKTFERNDCVSIFFKYRTKIPCLLFAI